MVSETLREGVLCTGGLTTCFFHSFMGREKKLEKSKVAGSFMINMKKNE
jgi:hypothetical protein